MKAIFISYNQAYYNEFVELLDKFHSRGFTMWEDVKGRGSRDGEPHYGDHAWPTMNNAILTMVEESVVDGILEEIKQIDSATPELGLRAFVWGIEKMY